MVSFAQLRDFDPEPLRGLAAAWTQLSGQLERRGDAVNSQGQRLSGHWDGAAYDAAAGRVRRLRGEFDATMAPLTGIARELSGAVEDLQRAQGMLLDAVADAGRIPATVSADGQRVGYTGPALDSESTVVSVEKRLGDVRDQIVAALGVAERADRGAAAALVKLVPGFDPAHPTQGVVPASAIPPRGSDPRAVNKWWNSLTPAQRQYLIHHHPDRVGGLDGVPAIHRDQANRVTLARDHEKAAARKKQIEARLKALAPAFERESKFRESDETGGEFVRTPAIGETLALRRELDLIDRNLKGITAIENRLYDTGKPRAYLLGFESGTLGDADGNGKPDDDGRVIVAVGNPDTADHVATFVPGTTAEISKFDGDIAKVDTMAIDTHPDRLGRTDEDTAVILWLGYDAPDEVNPNAISPMYAEDASANLGRFQDGLRVTHDGPTSHNTVMGHSYGTTVVGHAAAADLNHDGQPDGLKADELVFVASPGVSVERATDLGVSPDHVWATVADGDDWIQRAAVAGDKTGGGLGHDGNPTEWDFRGKVFASEPGGHSDYWNRDADTTARNNMARIITGQPGVTSPPPVSPYVPPPPGTTTPWPSAPPGFGPGSPPPSTPAPAPAPAPTPPK